MDTGPSICIMDQPPSSLSKVAKYLAIIAFTNYMGDVFCMVATPFKGPEIPSLCVSKIKCPPNCFWCPAHWFPTIDFMNIECITEENSTLPKAVKSLACTFETKNYDQAPREFKNFIQEMDGIFGKIILNIMEVVATHNMRRSMHA